MFVSGGFLINISWIYSLFSIFFLLLPQSEPGVSPLHVRGFLLLNTNLLASNFAHLWSSLRIATGVIFQNQPHLYFSSCKTPLALCNSQKKILTLYFYGLSWSIRTVSLLYIPPLSTFTFVALEHFCLLHLEAWFLSSLYLDLSPKTTSERISLNFPIQSSSFCPYS